MDAAMRQITVSACQGVCVNGLGGCLDGHKTILNQLSPPPPSSVLLIYVYFANIISETA